MTGFFVVKPTGIASHLVFVEWRNGVPLFAPSASLAMWFAHRTMAKSVRDGLSLLSGENGKGWEVLDLAEVETKRGRAKERLDALLNGVEKE